ncbi:hypothetical protein [Klebsiella phage KPP-5]|nr:hypothetical protein [Klebsiella phage KPP-5]
MSGSKIAYWYTNHRLTRLVWCTLKESTVTRLNVCRVASKKCLKAHHCKAASRLMSSVAAGKYNKC